MFNEHNELHCDISGKCEAPVGAHRITNCVHCGKELHEKDGEWWTWDAEFVKNPEPQDYIT